MRDHDNVLSLIKLRPDYIGFIFYEKSKRYVGELDLTLLESIPREIKKVGVFVNESLEKVLETVRIYSLDMVQLHGEESADDCARLKSEGIPVIKAISVSNGSDLKKIDPYLDHVDYFLFDTKGVGYGGIGIPFNWKILDMYDYDIPYFLSGGIGLEELNQLDIDKLPFGIDINSRFELSPGIKNMGLLKTGFGKINNL